MNKLYTLLLSMACVSTTQAQQQQKADTTMTRTVVVEREYTPDIMDANKVNVLPAVTPPSAQRPEVSYVNQLCPSAEIPAGTMAAEAPALEMSQVNKGILRLGYGSHQQYDALAAARLGLSKRDKLDLSASLQGHKANLELPFHPIQWHESTLQSKLKAGYLHRFNHMQLTADAHFRYAKFDNYPIYALSKQEFTDGGFQIGVRSLRHNLVANQTDENAGKATSASSGSQADEVAVATLGRSLLYDLNISANRYSCKADKGAKPVENSLALQGALYAPIDVRQMIELGVDLRHRLYSDVDFEDQTNLTLRPAYTYRNDSWHIRLGVTSDFSFGFGKKWRMAPDVEANYTTGTHQLYAHLKGGRIDNDFARLEAVSPYVQPMQLDATYEQLGATLGWKGSLMSDWWVHLYGGYQLFKNNLVPAAVGVEYGPGEGFPSTVCIYIPGVALTESHNLFVGAFTRYSFHEQMALRLSAIYRHWDFDEYECVAFTPKLDVDAAIEVNPLRCVGDLQLSLGYRHTTLVGELYECQSDLYFTGYYSLRHVYRGLGVFVQAHNLLDKSYQVSPAIPALGLRFLGGVSLQF